MALFSRRLNTIMKSELSDLLDLLDLEQIEVNPWCTIEWEKTDLQDAIKAKYKLESLP